MEDTMTENLIYNLIDTETTKYTEILKGQERFWITSSSLTQAFFAQFEDQVDFIFFLYVPSAGETPDITFRDVYRPPCPALGIGKEYGDWDCDHRKMHGYTDRLTAILAIPLVMDEAAPPPHISRELFRNWEGRLKGIENDPRWPKGWLHHGVHGIAGGFDPSSLKDDKGDPILNPLDIQETDLITVNRYKQTTSDVDQEFASIELWLMGLIGKEEVASIYFIDLKDRYLGPTADTYSIKGQFGRLTVDDLIDKNSGPPPRASSTTFRAAWVLVSEQSASPEVMARAKQYARIYGGLEEHTPAEGAPRWLSFAEATGDRAKLDVHLPARVTLLSEKTPEVLIPGEVTMTSHPNNRFITLKLPPDVFAGWATGRYNTSFDNVAYLSKPLYQKFKDDFDFIAFVLDLDEKPKGQPYGMLCPVSNTVEGIGKKISDNSDFYGSSGRLKAHMTLWMRTAMESGPFLHEVCHLWANHALETEAAAATVQEPLRVSPEGKNNGAHWGFSGCGGQLGGFDQSMLQVDVDGEKGVYSASIGSRGSFGMNANGGNGVPYSNFELYLMGLIPDTELTPFDVFHDVDLSVDTKTKVINGTSLSCWTGGKFKGTREHYDRGRILEELGPRVPSFQDSQKSFNVLVVVLSTASELDPRHQRELDRLLERQSRAGADCITHSYNFFEATGGRGRLSFDLSGSLLTAQDKQIVPTQPDASEPATDGAEEMTPKPPEGLVLWLPLDEIADGSVKDHSDSRRDGVCSQVMSCVDDPRFGRCLTFDGSQHVTIADLACPDAFTLAVWVKPQVESLGSGASLLGFGAKSPAVVMSNGEYGFLAPAASGYFLLNRGQSVEPGWSLVAITWDGQRRKLYINGGPAWYVDIETDTSGVGLKIGDKFCGEMAHIQLFNRVLSRDEVRSLYECTVQ